MGLWISGDMEDAMDEMDEMTTIGIEWEGDLLVKKCRTTNKVRDGVDEFTVVLKLDGLMPPDLFHRLTGADPQDPWRVLFWHDDNAPAHPSLREMRFAVEARNQVVEIGGDVGYTDNLATLRKFVLTPFYGEQFHVSFEMVLKPERAGVVGKLAMAEGYDVPFAIKGPVTASLDVSEA